MNVLRYVVRIVVDPCGHPLRLLILLAGRGSIRNFVTMRRRHVLGVSPCVVKRNMRESTWRARAGTGSVHLDNDLS